MLGAAIAIGMATAIAIASFENGRGNLPKIHKKPTEAHQRLLDGLYDIPANKLREKIRKQKKEIGA